MDRIEKTSNVIIELNKFNNGLLTEAEFVKATCSYFDSIKEEEQSINDLKFLRYLANQSGIPHFYSFLNRFSSLKEVDSFDLQSFSSIVNESTLHTSDDRMLHKYQKEILTIFQKGKVNRFFLSASTSFGKTHIVYEVIRKMNYKNVFLIFPTIALLSENLERILSDESFKSLSEKYKVHTLSEVAGYGENNLFIYTPERFLSFLEKNGNGVSKDFVFVDEVYKMDNEFELDEERKENERDVAYRLSVTHALQKSSTDVLLAGPYMNFSDKESNKYNPSFDNFISDNSFRVFNYNEYEIVNKSFYSVRGKKLSPSIPELTIEFSDNKKNSQLVTVVNEFYKRKENVIAYCAYTGKNGGVEFYAQKLIESNHFSNHISTEYDELLNHISDVFSEEWILVKALKHGIGIHHGLIPKYIQKEIIRLFNGNKISTLISTTTITEGVNTNAKNLIVLHAKKGNKDLKKFDAKNIAGRAGRFGYHYSGRVIDLSKSFNKVIEGEDEILKHKNYDTESDKDEIDLFYTDDKYLKRTDKVRKRVLKIAQFQRRIPEDVISQYKVISRKDKIEIYDYISELSEDEHSTINDLIKRVNWSLSIDFDGLQVIWDGLFPIVNNKSLSGLIERRDKNGVNSVLSSLISFYLQGGFMRSVDYHLSQEKSVDEAIKLTSKFVYNTLKYQVVKYLGVFNLMYKFFISQRDEISIEEVGGIDKLLLKFEYNALTDEGRLASDYGVPSKVLDYFESDTKKKEIELGFDGFELKSFERIKNIINEQQ